MKPDYFRAVVLIVPFHGFKFTPDDEELRVMKKDFEEDPNQIVNIRMDFHPDSLPMIPHLVTDDPTIYQGW